MPETDVAAPAKPALIVPKPIASFSNTALRDSISKALDGVRPDHGNAVLDVDNGGAGVMVAHRFGSGWALAVGGRYNFDDHGISARVAVSW